MDLSVFSHELPQAHLMENAPLREYSTMRVGGPADLMISPSEESEIITVLDIARRFETPLCILGNGSNLLFSDEGFRGVVLRLGSNFAAVECSGNCIHAQAGALLSTAAKAACDHSLAGLAFASGIPGSVGGAVFMNAGAYGGEMSQVLKQAQVLVNGRTETWSKEHLEFGYRHSALMDHDALVLSADFELQAGNREEIQAQMRELNSRRREKQPLQYPSCGSFFKRPAGHFAGALIEGAGLKGYRIGDAQVSELHAGFLINRGQATASQIYALMRHVQNTVYQASGVMLEPEVQLIGHFES